MSHLTDWFNRGVEPYKRKPGKVPGKIRLPLVLDTSLEDKNMKKAESAIFTEIPQSKMAASNMVTPRKRENLVTADPTETMGGSYIDTLSNLTRTFKSTGGEIGGFPELSENKRTSPA